MWGLKLLGKDSNTISINQNIQNYLYDGRAQRKSKNTKLPMPEYCWWNIRQGWPDVCRKAFTWSWFLSREIKFRGALSNELLEQS